MCDVTRILGKIESGDPSAAEQLLPLVYDELRKLAAAKLAQEKSGQTLQATALVHEAYLRLVGAEQEPTWANRGHFFAAAAEAMRRILVDGARRKRAEVYGGGHQRTGLRDSDIVSLASPERLLALDETLVSLAKQDAAAAELAGKLNPKPPIENMPRPKVQGESSGWKTTATVGRRLTPESLRVSPDSVTSGTPGPNASACTVEPT